MDYIDIFIKNNYINLKQIARKRSKVPLEKNMSGQIFRNFSRTGGMFFSGKTGIRILCREKDEEYFRRYLDLDTDYEKIIEQIDPEDRFLSGAAKMGKGFGFFVKICGR